MRPVTVALLLHTLLASNGHRYGGYVSAAMTSTSDSTPELNKHFGEFGESTMRFRTCNGFANQRLAIVYGIMIAKALNRSAVIPDMLSFGEQMTDETNMGDDSDQIAFEKVYDAPLFKDLMASLDILVMSPAEVSNFSYTQVDISDMANAAVILQQHKAVQHLQIACPLWKIPAQQMRADAHVVKAILKALQPSQAIANHVNVVTRFLQSLSADGSFYFLHLRLEDDWTAHCKRWASIDDGIIRDNCLNNSLNIAEQLANKGFDVHKPLYVSMFWNGVEQESASQALKGLILDGYNVIAKPEKLGSLASLPREQAAAVNYFVAMESKRFIGNSVSTYSALLILERRQEGRWASYYNGGNIPLADQLPLYSLPWVFTYNSWSHDYDSMLKAAVASAKAHGTLQPLCLYSGDTSSPAFRWMARQGVQVVVRDPAWAGMLEKGLARKDNIEHSHLYSESQMAIGTWQRIDVPLLPQLTEHEYVLFTDCDVFFRRPVTLEDFQLPLPASIGMGIEMADMFPYNAGVMLMNLPYLRATYKNFADFIFSNNEGMFFPGYGPGDQGAYNQFYEQSARQYRLPDIYNAKPYRAFDPKAVIVHFHGPKPAQFMKFLRTGKCDFRQGADMCALGLHASYCQYLQEWSAYLPARGAFEAQKALAMCDSRKKDTL